MRRRAKIVNFGIIYGMSPYGLAQELNCTPEEGHLIINSYFKTYPGVKEWIDRVVEDASKQGCTETMLGRKRRIPELASENFNTREFGKRIAINTPVQGSAADIIKQAMISIDERLKSESVDAVMVLQIHDELLFEVKKDAVEAATRIIVDEMEHVIELSVPLVVDVGVGKNWFEAH
jgi:DNA polymerase-1